MQVHGEARQRRRACVRHVGMQCYVRRDCVDRRASTRVSTMATPRRIVDVHLRSRFASRRSIRPASLRGLRPPHRRAARAAAASRSNTCRPRACPSTPPRIRASTSSARGRGRAPRPHRPSQRPLRRRPAGRGWTVDPFGGAGARRAHLRARRVRHEGRHRGRHLCRGGDPARRRRAAPDRSRSAARVDEESGGFAGMAWLARQGRVSARRAGLRDHPGAAERRPHLHRSSRRLLVRGHNARTDRARQHAVSRRQRHRAHGRSSWIGMRRELLPALAARDDGDAGRPGTGARTRRSTSTASPAASRSTASRRRASPTRAARSSTAVSCSRRASSGQGGDRGRCSTRAAAETPSLDYELRDLMVVHPVRTPATSPVIGALERGIAARARPPGRARRQPRHLRPQARRSHRRHPALRRLRPGHPRSGAPARRVVRHRRPDQRDEGAGAGRARADGHCAA